MEFNKKILITLALSIAFPVFVSADCVPDATTVCPENPMGVDSSGNPITFLGFVNKAIDTIFTFAVIFMPLMVIIGASMMMLQGMSEENIKKGKMIIRFSLIGFAIILLAKGIVVMVKQTIGG